jgi:hypothetical protein
MTGLSEPMAAQVRQLANQLHDALHPAMIQHRPGAEVELLWQAAKMINGAAGGLYQAPDVPAEQAHFDRWYDVAVVASDIAEKALAIAAADMTLKDATAQLMTIDVNAADPVGPEACAYAATVEVYQPGPDPGDEGRTISATIDGGYERTLTAAHNGQTLPRRTYTAAGLLTVAHHLHHLGKAIGTALPAAGGTDDLP